jgi:hypothetical protein
VTVWDAVPAAVEAIGVCLLVIGVGLGIWAANDALRRR